MERRGTSAGARVLEVALVVWAAAAAVVGVLRAALGPAALGGYLPGDLRDVVNRWAGVEFLGESPAVRAGLAPSVRFSTDPPLYVHQGGGEVPAGRGELSGPFEAQVNVYDPSAAQTAGLVGAALLKSAAVVVVVLLLLRVVRTLRRGDPFALANARRLRWVAAAVAVGWTGGSALGEWGEHLVLTDPAVRPFVVDRVDVDLLPLLVALGVLLLAEVFRRGAAMRRDLEGLV